jgi:hypothetical protein
MVPCSYEGIKQAMHGATIDFVMGESVGCYVDDNGLIEEALLNVPISMMFGRPLYGPAVMCAAQPDNFGHTLAPPDDAVVALQHLALAWRHVVAGARQIGQEPFVRANADTVPPPKVVAMDEEQFSAWLETGEMPT